MGGRLIIVTEEGVKILPIVHYIIYVTSYSSISYCSNSEY